MSGTEKNIQTPNLEYEEPRNKTHLNENEVKTKNTANAVSVITTIKEIKYGEIPYRWFFLVSYCLLNFVNQMQWVCFSAILTDFSKNYNKPQWKINMFSLIYMIVYPIVCIPQAWMLDKFSIKISLKLAAATNIIGAGLKLLVNKDSSLASCYVGQVFACIFQPILLNSPGKISANWFREDIRTVICTICCSAIILGALIGFLWNLLFIKEDMEQNEFKDQVFNYFLSEFILCILFCAPTFFINKDKPEIPTSPSQEEFDKKTPGLFESLKLLFTNVRFVYLFISYLLVVGYYDIISTIINSLLDIYKINGTKSSVIYGVGTIVGMIASLVISKILDKNKKFKLVLVLLSICGSIFQALFTFLLELFESKGLNSYPIGLVMYSLINISIISFNSIGLNYACEITYPVGESLNGSIMASTPQILAVALTFLCDYCINHVDNKKWISNVILLILLVLSIIFGLLLDEKLDRQEIEQIGRLRENKETNIIDIKNK